ncbi:hypothetical protein NHX12_019173 [Muraenolepis orangiensis]|uniref:Uncharacterized protein n=1 Tax=Muraenolepis orangiensis TaxID=630683 RepID=A0A9Q0EWA1_9TELE|nr:hypothetical protein NHX12_019173 [Muraenolepis orangiensis]
MTVVPTPGLIELQEDTQKMRQEQGAGHRTDPWILALLFLYLLSIDTGSLSKAGKRGAALSIGGEESAHRLVLPETCAAPGDSEREACCKATEYTGKTSSYRNTRGGRTSSSPQISGRSK